MKVNIQNSLIKTGFIRALLLVAVYFLYQVDSHSCNVKAEFSYSIDVNKLTLVNLSTGANVYLLSPGDNNIFKLGQWDTLIHYYSSYWPETYTFALVAIDTNFSNCTDTFRLNIKTSLPKCHVYAHFNVLDDSAQSFSGLIENKSFISRPSKTSLTWYFGDGDSSNSFNPTHIYPGPGTYNLCIKLRDSSCTFRYCDYIEFDTNGLMKRMIPYSIKVFGSPTTSIKENKTRTQNIQIMPNPANGWLRIRNNGGLIRCVRIMDSYGKEILTQTFDGDELLIDLSAYSEGIYYINVTDEKSQMNTFGFLKS